jgi:hypothetical protein
MLQSSAGFEPTRSELHSSLAGLGHARSSRANHRQTPRDWLKFWRFNQFIGRRARSHSYLILLSTQIVLTELEKIHPDQIFIQQQTGRDADAL